MSKIAVISDVHGNLEALTAVMARIDTLGVDRIYSLGDVVGYGPDPEGCLALIEQRCQLRLMGNHEYAAFHGASAAFNPVARQGIEWTRQRLMKAGLLDSIGKLSSYFQEGDALYVHGSVRNALNHYLMELDRNGYSTFDEVTSSLDEDFTSFNICFVGHNHKPFLATAEGFLHPHESLPSFHVPRDEKFYVSVGSVGQPRDSDPRACFVTYNGDMLTYHRVDYPFEVTAEKIRSCGLPDILADRLAVGR